MSGDRTIVFASHGYVIDAHPSPVYTMDINAGRPLTRGEITDLLAEARDRTLLLTAALSDEDLRLQHDPLMSPIVWDLGHIGHFEEVWLRETSGVARRARRGFEASITHSRTPAPCGSRFPSRHCPSVGPTSERCDGRCWKS